MARLISSGKFSAYNSEGRKKKFKNHPNNKQMCEALDILCQEFTIDQIILKQIIIIKIFINDLFSKEKKRKMKMEKIIFFFVLKFLFYCNSHKCY